MWCNAIKNTGKPKVSFFVQGIPSKVGRRGKTRTAVQLGQKLKHPRIEIKAINGSGLIARFQRGELTFAGCLPLVTAMGYISQT